MYASQRCKEPALTVKHFSLFFSSLSHFIGGYKVGVGRLRYTSCFWVFFSPTSHMCVKKRKSFIKESVRKSSCSQKRWEKLRIKKNDDITKWNRTSIDQKMHEGIKKIREKDKQHMGRLHHHLKTGSTCYITLRPEESLKEHNAWLQEFDHVWPFCAHRVPLLLITLCFKDEPTSQINPDRLSAFTVASLPQQAGKSRHNLQWLSWE